MVETPGILDSLEDAIENSERPAREAIEDMTNEIPSGPYDAVGDGDALGVLAYYAISTGQLAVLPIPGIRQPGYHTISHGAEDMGTYERHDVRINAASRDVAEFAAKYAVASPSNIDYLTSEVQAVETNEVTSRSTLSTWEVIVHVADRGKTQE